MHDVNRRAALASPAIGRGWRVAGWACVVVALAAPAASAQQPDSTRISVVRATTPFEVQVERLARMLVNQQQRVMDLSGTRQQLRVSLRTPSLDETQRSTIALRLRAVESQLSSIGASARSLRQQLEALCASSRSADGWLGLVINSDYSMDVSPNGARMSLRRYPEVESVEPRSPAEKAGLRRGDVLMAIGDRDLSDAELSLGELLKPGARLTVRLKRGVETRTASVLVEARPADFQPTCTWEDDLIARALGPGSAPMSFVVSPAAGGRTFTTAGSGDSTRPGGARAMVLAPNGDDPGMSGFVLSTGSASQTAIGAQLVPLNEGLASLSGAERGIFVVDVARRSPAAQSGLKAGDVIVSAEGRALRTPAMLLQLMERAEPRELTLQVVRRRKAETVVLAW